MFDIYLGSRFRTEVMGWGLGIQDTEPHACGPDDDVGLDMGMEESVEDGAQILFSVQSN